MYVLPNVCYSLREIGGKKLEKYRQFFAPPLPLLPFPPVAVVGGVGLLSLFAVAFFLPKPSPPTGTWWFFPTTVSPSSSSSFPHSCLFWRRFLHLQSRFSQPSRQTAPMAVTLRRVFFPLLLALQGTWLCLSSPLEKTKGMLLSCEINHL